MKRTFAKEQLTEELDLPGNKELTVEEELVSKDRWAVEYRLVFRLPGMPENEAWETYYRVGATEEQDERPWEFDDEVECTLVELKEVTTKQWVTKEDSPT